MLSLFLIKLLIMNSRELDLVALRPEIPSAIVTPLMSFDEQFQNKTLRPIVKLQNELFVMVFRNYVSKHKNVFYTLSLDKRLQYIENAIQKDIKFRNSLKGMVIGQFTIEEYELYIQNSSSLNKRMMNLVIERLKSNIQLLEYECVH
tara:strand:+ start:56432 stop:56872 length:441 start_codon:yes stop_codon:yes gene_type:complete